MRVEPRPLLPNYTPLPAPPNSITHGDRGIEVVWNGWLWAKLRRRPWVRKPR